MHEYLHFFQLIQWLDAADWIVLVSKYIQLVSILSQSFFCYFDRGAINWLSSSDSACFSTMASIFFPPWLEVVSMCTKSKISDVTQFFCISVLFFASLLSFSQMHIILKKVAPLIENVNLDRFSRSDVFFYSSSFS